MALFNGVDYNLEYRSKKDETWYTCGVVLEDGKQLCVMFKDFIQSYFDEVYSIADFWTHHEIEQFLKRFRPVSGMIEDNECSRVIEGMKVCAMYKGADEVLYFDAIVDAVHHKEHTPEKCLCTYLLFWQHGPGVSFQSQVFGSVGCRRERSCPELSDHDIDLGGDKKPDCYHYCIVLENLDKDLCPLLMMDFIHEHTSITTQTFVFPSLLAETYARGAIVVDSSIKLKRIYEFINNPNHFITSFSGRP
ncbi:hypothetical protein L1987_78352 [Smallanthus sonchifolius]|uniref:Uncharacterized protein n=1 Tax=Smallanthus sonchifolius TaxID=185202 RepID=A0ACB8ZCY2_9ASTR|nr:hypothetical protein L1987_78352 [Smallanthus sonchifolius]